MKTTAFFPLFIFFAFTSSLAIAVFFLEEAGDLLRNGGVYYVLPDIWAKGGGLALAKIGNETCPLTVVQLPPEILRGSPQIISSPFRIEFVMTDLILDLFFLDVPTCTRTPSKWTIVEGEDNTKSLKITGCDHTVKGWFKIQKYSSWAYWTVFCSTDADSCEDVGISRDDHGNRRLVISDGNPFAVVFQKVESLYA